MVFWSPDGQFIGFCVGVKLKKVSARGGTPLPICDVPGLHAATWSQDGVIVASTGWFTPSWVITVGTGIKTPLPQTPIPKFLPDGKHVLHLSHDTKTQALWVSVADYATGQSTALMPTQTQVVFVPDEQESSHGYLISGKNATLLAQRFDANTLRVSGEPVPVAENVPFFANGWSDFDASAGMLMYTTGSPRAQLTWLDRHGRQTGVLGEPQHIWGFFRLSPDGRKVAADVFDTSEGATQIWVYDVSTGAGERVTFESNFEGQPVWSPDGRRLAYCSAQQNTPPQLRMKRVTDHGAGERFPATVFQTPYDWSSDGKWVIYTEGGKPPQEIWAASVADRARWKKAGRRYDTGPRTSGSARGRYLPCRSARARKPPCRDCPVCSRLEASPCGTRCPHPF